MNQLNETTTLDKLLPGQAATVAALETTGASRRRLMDLGILPGTKLTAEMRSPLGDPTAYRIRGAVIALRREQARQIQVTVDSMDEVRV